MVDQDRRALFDDWAEHYDSSVQGRTDFPFMGYEDVLARVEQKAGKKRGQSVLDVGIGTGNLASRFLGSDREVWGLDFSREMLEHVRKRFPTIQLIQADLSTGSIDVSCRFDRIVSAYVLHEFALPVKTRIIQWLVETHLNPGGRVVIADISFPTRELRAAASQEWTKQWDSSEHYWAADETFDTLAGAGIAGTYEQVSRCAGVFVFGDALRSRAK